MVKFSKVSAAIFERKRRLVSFEEGKEKHAQSEFTGEMAVMTTHLLEDNDFGRLRESLLDSDQHIEAN